MLTLCSHFAHKIYPNIPLLIYNFTYFMTNSAPLNTQKNQRIIANSLIFSKSGKRGSNS